MKTIKIRNQKGVTLVELILATLVLIIIVGVLSRILSKGLDSIDYGNKETELRQNGRVALTRITRELRQCQSVVAVSNEAEFPKYIEFDDSNGIRMKLRRNAVTGNLDYGPSDYLNANPLSSDYALVGPILQSLGISCYREDKNDEGIKTGIIKMDIVDESLVRVIIVSLSLEEIFGDKTHTVNLRSAVFLRKEM